MSKKQTIEQGYIMNPVSKRRVKIGSPTFRTLLATNVIDESGKPIGPVSNIKNKLIAKRHNGNGKVKNSTIVMEVARLAAHEITNHLEKIAELRNYRDIKKYIETLLYSALISRTARIHATFVEGKKGVSFTMDEPNPLAAQTQEPPPEEEEDQSVEQELEPEPEELDEEEDIGAEEDGN